MSRSLTAAIWTIALGTLLIGGSLATVFVFMATSIDPTDLATDGLQSWNDAGMAVAAFAGLLVATLVGLRLWHGVRFKILGAILLLASAVLVGWACLRVYTEYF
jgi:hypothetical protein